MSAVKVVLSAAEAAKELTLGIKICRQLFGYTSDDSKFPIRVGLAESLEDEIITRRSQNNKLRAEITRLRGLIEGMEHERGCKALWVHSERTGRFRRRTYNSPNDCNCVKSQVAQ